MRAMGLPPSHRMYPWGGPWEGQGLHPGQPIENGGGFPLPHIPLMALGQIPAGPHVSSAGGIGGWAKQQGWEGMKIVQWERGGVEVCKWVCYVLDIKKDCSEASTLTLCALWLTCLPSAAFRLWIWALLSTLLLMLPCVPSPLLPHSAFPASTPGIP